MADGSSLDKVPFNLVAPERTLVSTEVDMVVVPGAEGDFGVLPQHSLLISLLRPGVIEIYQSSQVTERIFVGGGFAEVNERGCTVLAEEAMPVSELVMEQARRRLSDAEDDLRDATSETERRRAERELAIAEAAIQAVG
jgi:F-type H+-transporting ATPase subunit epsilon